MSIDRGRCCIFLYHSFVSSSLSGRRASCVSNTSSISSPSAEQGYSPRVIGYVESVRATAPAFHRNQDPHVCGAYCGTRDKYCKCGGWLKDSQGGEARIPQGLQPIARYALLLPVPFDEINPVRHRSDVTILIPGTTVHSTRFKKPVNSRHQQFDV
jgi:hypothetical protein